MKQKIIMGVVAVVLLIGAFFGGIKYGQTPKALAKLSRTQITAAFAGGRTGGAMGGTGMGFAGRGGAGANGGFVSGQVLSLDDKSVTVKMQNGSTKIIFFADSTTIGKSTAGAKTDITVGNQLTVTGTTNSDGSVTAQNIQIRPDMPPAAN